MGCEGELIPILEWKDPNPFKINYVGVFSYQHEGHWKINRKKFWYWWAFKFLIFNSTVDNFKVPIWVPAKDASVPPGAVETGETKRGPHYIARVKNELTKSHIPARLLPRYKCLYGFLGVEYESKEYEVLCGGAGHWVTVTNGKIPSNAFACTDANTKNNFFIGRAPLDNWILCGKVYPHDGLCLVAYQGREHIFGNYEIFVVWI